MTVKAAATRGAAAKVAAPGGGQKAVPRRKKRRALGALARGTLEKVELWLQPNVLLLTGKGGEHAAVSALYNGRPNPGRYAIISDEAGGWFRNSATGGQQNARGQVVSWRLPPGMSLNYREGYEFQVRRGSPAVMPGLVALGPEATVGFLPGGSANASRRPSSDSSAPAPAVTAAPTVTAAAAAAAAAVTVAPVRSPPTSAPQMVASASAPPAAIEATAALAPPKPLKLAERFGVIDDDRGLAEAEATERRIGARGRAQRTHESSAAKLETAEAASVYPEYEDVSREQALTVDQVATASRSVADADPRVAAGRLEAGVKAAKPATLKELDKFSKPGKMDRVKASVQATVASQTRGLRGTFKGIETVGRPVRLNREHEGALPDPESAPGSRSIDAARVLPPPVPESALDASEFKGQADNAMTPLEVSPRVLAVARAEKDHPMAALAARRDAVETASDSAGNAARATEGQVLGEARGSLRAEEEGANAGMRGTRKRGMGKVQDQMSTRKKGGESDHKSFADTVRDTYINAKGDVNKKLSTLTKVVGSDFDAAAEGYLRTFKDGIERDMDAFKKDRYDHWYSRGTKIYDWARGLSRLSAVKAFYAKNKQHYIDSVNGLIKRTNSAINKTIAECKEILTRARQAVQSEFRSLSTKEQAGARATLAGVLKQFKSLEGRIGERASALKQKVTAKRKGAVESMEGELSRIKKSNQGFVNDVVDGVKAVAKALAKFALLVSRVSQRGVGSFISDLLSQAWDGIKNHLWKAIVVAFKDWLGAKVAPLTAVMNLPANALEVLASLGDTLLSFFLDVLPSAMKSVVKAFLAWFGEQAVRKLIPGFGSVGVIIDGLKAAWSFVRRVMSAAGRFFGFLMAVGAGKKVPQMFAGALAQGLIAGLDAVLTFFGVNKLIRRVGGAIAGPFKKKFAPLARGFARRKQRQEQAVARRVRRRGAGGNRAEAERSARGGRGASAGLGRDRHAHAGARTPRRRAEERRVARQRRKEQKKERRFAAGIAAVRRLAASTNNESGTSPLLFRAKLAALRLRYRFKELRLQHAGNRVFIRAAMSPFENIAVVARIIFLDIAGFPRGESPASVRRVFAMSRSGKQRLFALKPPATNTKRYWFRTRPVVRGKVVTGRWAKIAVNQRAANQRAAAAEAAATKRLHKRRRDFLNLISATKSVTTPGLDQAALGTRPGGRTKSRVPRFIGTGGKSMPLFHVPAANRGMVRERLKIGETKHSDTKRRNVQASEFTAITGARLGANLLELTASVPAGDATQRVRTALKDGRIDFVIFLSGSARISEVQLKKLRAGILEGLRVFLRGRFRDLDVAEVSRTLKFVNTVVVKLSGGDR